MSLKPPSVEVDMCVFGFRGDALGRVFRVFFIPYAYRFGLQEEDHRYLHPVGVAMLSLRVTGAISTIMAVNLLPAMFRAQFVLNGEGFRSNVRGVDGQLCISTVQVPC